MLTKKLGIWLVVAAIIIFGILFIASHRNIAVIKIGTGIVEAEIAQTDEARKLGLGIYKKLEANQGMLFVFEQSDTHSIWMKDVEFPIDVIWLDKNKKVVYVEPDMQPNSYPSLFRPDEPALYVIEVPAGFAGRYNISDGTQANW